jgi:hypothetical protein
VLSAAGILCEFARKQSKVDALFHGSLFIRQNNCIEEIDIRLYTVYYCVDALFHCGLLIP